MNTVKFDKGRSIVMIGSDHGGFELKNILVQNLKDFNYRVVDVGPYEHDPNDDYPGDALWNVCTNVWDCGRTGNRGILICGTGVGMCVAANKYEGIRAVVGNSETSIVKQAVEHVNCNVLCLGAVTSANMAWELVKIFLETEFSEEERHVRRLNKIKDIEWGASRRRGDQLDEYEKVRQQHQH